MSTETVRIPYGPAADAQSKSLIGFRIRGSLPGPKILITAGIHGCEYPGIETASRLTRFLTEESVCGEVLILPCVNRSAFAERMKALVPEDGKNLNRQFPGRSDGTESEQIAAALTALQDEADFYIDMHGGDLHEALYPYVYIPGACDAEVTEKARRAAESLDLPVRILSGAATGAYNSAARRGTPSLLIERGNLGLWNEAIVAEYFEDLLRLLSHLGAYRGAVKPKMKHSEQRESATCSYPAPASSGCWHPVKQPGDAVRRGECLGEIRSLEGEVLERICAPHAGVILYQTASLFAPAGHEVLCIG